jgi:putative ABC transport system permease protein
MLVYVVIAAVSTLVMAALARRRELAILRLTGVTRIQVLRMVRLEQALLVGLAMVAGGAIAAATFVPMVKGTTGTATPYIPPGGWATVVGGTVLLAGAGRCCPCDGCCGCGRSRRSVSANELLRFLTHY